MNAVGMVVCTIIYAFLVWLTCMRVSMPRYDPDKRGQTALAYAHRRSVDAMRRRLLLSRTCAVVGLSTLLVGLGFETYDYLHPVPARSMIELPIIESDGSSTDSATCEEIELGHWRCSMPLGPWPDRQLPLPEPKPMGMGI